MLDGQKSERDHEIKYYNIAKIIEIAEQMHNRILSLGQLLAE